MKKEEIDTVINCWGIGKSQELSLNHIFTSLTDTDSCPKETAQNTHTSYNTHRTWIWTMAVWPELEIKSQDLEREYFYLKVTFVCWIPTRFYVSHMYYHIYFLIRILWERYIFYSHFTAEEVEDTPLWESNSGFKISLFLPKIHVTVPLHFKKRIFSDFSLQFIVEHW